MIKVLYNLNSYIYVYIFLDKLSIIMWLNPGFLITQILLRMTKLIAEVFVGYFD